MAYGSPDPGSYRVVMDYRRDRVRFLQAPTGEVRVVVDHGQPYGRLVAVVPPDDDDNPTEAST